MHLNWRVDSPQRQRPSLHRPLRGLGLEHQVVLEALPQPPEQERYRHPAAGPEQVGRDPGLQGAEQDEDLAPVLSAQQVVQHPPAARRVLAQGMPIAPDQVAECVADGRFHQSLLVRVYRIAQVYPSSPAAMLTISVSRVVLDRKAMSAIRRSTDA